MMLFEKTSEFMNENFLKKLNIYKTQNLSIKNDK